MSDLIVVAYDKEGTAEEVLRTLEGLQGQYLIEMEDAAYVTRNKDGKVRLHNTIPLGGAGAVRGPSGVRSSACSSSCPCSVWQSAQAPAT